MSAFRPASIEESIARIIFENMSDIDGDEADWQLVREDCMDAADEILKRFPLCIEQPSTQGGEG